jgi:hypothetical protein
MKARGGQPRDAADRRRDRVIGATVHVLLGWGFSLRREGVASKPGVAEVVGQVATKVIGRASRHGGALSEQQVERIYEEWLGQPWRRRVHSHQRYAKAWRRQFVPFNCRAPLERLAACLLSNEGRWPRDQADIAAWGRVVVLITSSEWFGHHFRFPLVGTGIVSVEAAATVLGRGAAVPSGWKTSGSR